MAGALARNKAEKEYRSGMWVVAVLHRVLRQALVDEEVSEQRWKEVRAIYSKQRK